MAVDSMGVMTITPNDVKNLRTDFKTEGGTAVTVDNDTFYTLKSENSSDIVIAARTTSEGAPTTSDKAKFTVYGYDSVTIKFESGKNLYAWAVNGTTDLVISEAAV